MPGLEKWVVWNIFSCVNAFADVGKELVFEKERREGLTLSGSESLEGDPSRVVE